MTESDILKKLEKLEEQNVHLHQHLETIEKLLFRLERRIMNVPDVGDIDIDLLDECEQYTPINEIDRLYNQTRLKELKEKREETEQKADQEFFVGIRSDLNE